MAGHPGVAPARVERLRSVIDEPQASGELGGAGWANLIDEGGRPGPGASILRRELCARTGRALERLDPREREIVVRRFGIGGDDERTLHEMAGLLGVSRERVRQIEARAMRKLRRSIPASRPPPPGPGGAGS